jgi:hypothetical protein
MMNNDGEIFEVARSKAIEDVLKEARDDLIRKKAMNLIFEYTTDQLLQIAYTTEKNEALSIKMEDAQTYLKELATKQSEILPLIYPDIFSRHFYPE